MCILLSSHVGARSDLDDLFQMPLEELMEVKVSVLSGYDQQLTSIPAHVTVIHGRQLRALNPRSLWDLMYWVPGIEPMLDRDQKNFAVRGVVSGNGVGVLFLVDGKPFYDSGAIASWGIETPVFNPDIVEQVEIIRGPGGAWWDGNPFLAVINIRLKKATITGNEVRLYTGEHNTRGGVLVVGKRNGDITGNLNVSLHESDGEIIRSETSIGPDNGRLLLNENYGNSNPPFGEADFRLGQYDPSYSITGQLDIGSLSIDGFVMHHQGQIRQLETGQGRNHVNEINRGFLQVSYPIQINTNDAVEVKLSRNIAQMDWYADHGQAPVLDNQWRSEDTQASVEYRRQTHHEDLLARLTVLDGDRGENTFTRYIFNQGGGADVVSTVQSRETERSYGFVASYNRNVSDALDVRFGGKYSWSKNVDVVRRDFDPHVGFVWHPRADRNIKLSYSESSLTPTMEQVRFGFDENTKTQRVSAYELSWSEDLTKHWRITSVFFLQQLDNALLQQSLNGERSFINIGGIDSRGVELESRALIGVYTIWGDLAYVQTDYNENNNVVANPDAVRFDESGNGLSYPEWSGAIGVLSNWSNWDSTLKLRFNRGVRVRTLYADDNPLGVSLYDELGTRIEFDANIHITLSKNAGIDLSMENLLDKRKPQPTTVFNGVTQGHGRYLQMELQYTF